MVDRCKYCGSSVAESDVSVTRFVCESYVNGGEWTQSPDCMAEELRTLRALRDKVEAAPHGWQFVADDGSLGVIATSHHPPFPDSYYRKVKLVPVEAAQ